MDDFQRRTFLKLSLPAFLKLAAVLPALGGFARRANAQQGRLKEDTPLHWDAFLENIHREAEKQTQAFWDEDDYVEKAAALARRLNIQDPVLQKIFARYQNKHPNFPEFEIPHKEQTFQISLIQFEPGEVIRHHNHPGMTGVLLCASGALQVENFDEVQEQEGAPLFLRRTGSLQLPAGKVSTLTSKRRNIHTVRAGQFTQVIDVFAPPYNKERSDASVWYELDPKPVDGEPDLFRAERA